jgi:hypothetical protein
MHILSHSGVKQTENQTKDQDNGHAELICDTFTLTSLFCDAALSVVELKNKDYYNIVLMNNQKPSSLHTLSQLNSIKALSENTFICGE